MAENFYNRITQKIGRGSGADRLSESIGGAAQKAGDSLKEQQAVQDYQKSKAGSELGISLTKAAGEAAQAYGQATKDFDTNSIINLKMAEVNETKAKISAETNPKKQAKLIKAAKKKFAEYSSTIRQELQELGHGGLDLEKRAQALDGEYTKMVRDTSKTNMERMSKVQQEMFTKQLNLVVNDVSRSYKTPTGDSEGVRKLFAQSEARHGKGSVEDIIEKKTIMIDSTKGRVESSLNNHDPKWALEYLKSKGPRQFLTQKEYSAYEKRALKRVANGDNPTKFTFKHIKTKSQDPVYLKGVMDRLKTEQNIPHLSDAAGVLQGIHREAAKNGTAPKNVGLELSKVLGKYKLDTSEYALAYTKLSELNESMITLAGDDEGGYQELSGRRSIGLTKTELDDTFKSLSKSFDDDKKMPRNLREGVTNKNLSRLMVVQAKGSLNKMTASAFRHLTENVSDENDPIRLALGKGTLSAHIKRSDQIANTPVAYEGLVGEFNDSSIIGVNTNEDPRQVKRMALLKATISASQDSPEEWRALSPAQQYILINEKIGKYIDEVIEKNRGNRRSLGESISDTATRFGPVLQGPSYKRRPRSFKEGF